MEHHRKKNTWPRGDSNLRRRSQSTDMLCFRPSNISKKGCIKPRTKEHCLFPFVLMLILTSWLMLFLLCNQYYCNLSLYINYIYSIICHGTSLKKTLGHMGTRTCIAGLGQQTCYALDHDHQTSTKEDASSPGLSNTVFSHSIVLMLILTSWLATPEKTVLLSLMHPFWWCLMVESIACLLTETGNKGSSNH